MVIPACERYSSEKQSCSWRVEFSVVWSAGATKKRKQNIVNGWGYGGYIVSMMLASDSENVLKCGAAINPIVSFKYYNSFFTERYVIQPADNGRALLDSDLSMKVGNFASKKYLLIHGTADTQVHEQHTAILTKSLIEVGVMFRHQVYVDENHSLSGVIAHVYQTIEAYFEENFLNDNQDWTTAFFLSKT
uniref:Venom dipeptidyl peptidase 4 n=1 Tax=Culex pipiens TaxID=7175 RepID=A0A8D8NG71_CULPI